VKARKVDVRVFVSYAHRDPPLFRQLLESLLRWPGVSVTVWTDENVTPGSQPDKEIRAELQRMHIFVALITPFFDASSYIQEVEVPIAKRRSKNGEALIAPVVVSHPGGTKCNWLLGLERLPDKRKSWVDIRKESMASGGYDEALQPLRDGIWKLVQQVRNYPGTLLGRKRRKP
jgi:TIR domain